MKRLAYAWSTFLFILLVACGRAEGEPVPTSAAAAATVPAPTATTVVIPTLISTPEATQPPPPSPAPIDTAVPPTPTAIGPCEIIADQAVDVYQRPSREAGIFGTLDPSFRPLALARTPDAAWIGFDPAVAQAANVGVFRLRWVAAGSVRLEGGCDVLEVVEGPPPGVCFTMPMEETTVYGSPALDASALVTLVPGDYTAVTGLYGDDWAQVDLDVGSLATGGQGWVEATTLNLNGPCDLPDVTP